MSISSLFSGMEAYLDGDVEINNNVSVPDDAAADAEIADQTAEVASDTADATEEAKDTEVASQMLSRMCDMYDHVKQFGIDRTFVSLYNRHGELDRVCGMQFPSCESMDVVGDRYSRYSTAFIAAMEDEKEGLWAKFKKMVAKIWNWIKEKVSNIWNKIKHLFMSEKAKKEELKKKYREEAAKINKGDMTLKEAKGFHPWIRIKRVGGWVFRTTGHVIGGVTKFLWHHKFLVTLIAAFVADAVMLKKAAAEFKEAEDYVNDNLDGDTSRLSAEGRSEYDSRVFNYNALTVGRLVLGGATGLTALLAIVRALRGKRDKIVAENKNTAGSAATADTQSFNYNSSALYGYPGLEEDEESTGVPMDAAVDAYGQIDSELSKSMPALDKSIGTLQGIVKQINDQIQRSGVLPSNVCQALSQGINSIQDVINVGIKTAAEAARVVHNFVTAKPVAA